MVNLCVRGAGRKRRVLTDRPPPLWCRFFRNEGAWRNGRMYAVVRTGGKQYKVAENDVIEVETLPGAAGDRVALDEVLMVSDGAGVTIGAPTVAGASVAATVLEQTRDDKIIVFKKLRRKGYRRKRGHRQMKTVLRIGAISVGDGASEGEADGA